MKPSHKKKEKDHNVTIVGNIFKAAIAAFLFILI